MIVPLTILFMALGPQIFSVKMFIKRRDVQIFPDEALEPNINITLILMLIINTNEDISF